MKLSFKQALQVIASFLVAIFIFWYLYKDIKMDSLLNALQEASSFYIGLSVALSIIGYWLRAWRWKLLIKVGEDKMPSVARVFWALMGGYLANLLVPRAGEVARCGYLTKTDQLPMGKLVGTVILERTVDLISMILVIIFTFFVQRTIFTELLDLLVSQETLEESLIGALPIALGMVIIIGLVLYVVFSKYRESSLIKKIRHFLRDLMTGLKSIKKVDTQTGFWGATLGIWVIYFFMMYFVAIAVPSTATLSASAVLMVMVMGSIGMVAPVQGGIGTFHALVAFILMTYGLTEEDGKIFAVIVHTSQLLTIMGLGVISVVILAKLTSTKQPLLK
ncbi:lysylphosphatidylglycerol synthase transmembrane domain-containing protein [Anditalea andensis]|uniref:Membrane protein n=1 Tax=Anditalea andensis TaxID=1048983 RepID=A0A074KT96_9BACT|nr:lysylphosphatidylglycerol synthase transmembrane domain-containing protein [Anditalea andensis]KEO72099.1 membrane protein [Anditalea andensis]